MSNRTYVCLDCKTARRAEAAYGLVHDLRCSLCSQSLTELPWRRRVPSKDDKKGWKELAVLLAQQEKEWLSKRNAMGKAKLEKLDKQISSSRSEEKKKKLLFQRRTVQEQYDCRIA
jgi:hypothetical protein